MIYFLNTHLNKKQRIRLYRLALLLDDIDFGYLRPVTLATLLVCILYIGDMYLPYLSLLTGAQIGLYIFLVVFVSTAFIYYLIPYLIKIRAKIRVYNYRRKKRATFTLFL